MSDFNFFEPYKKRQFRSDSAVSVTKIVLIFATFVLLGFCGFEFYNKIQLENELKEKRAYIDDPANKDLINKRSETIKKRDDLKVEQASYVNLDIITNLANEASSDKFSKVVLNNVYGVFLSNIDIGSGAIKISAYASDMDKVANYESSLRNTGLFTSVFIADLAPYDKMDSIIKDQELETKLNAQLPPGVKLDQDVNVFSEKLYPIAFVVDLTYDQTIIKAEDIVKILGNDTNQQAAEDKQMEDAQTEQQSKEQQPSEEVQEAPQ